MRQELMRVWRTGRLFVTLRKGCALRVYIFHVHVLRFRCLTSVAA